MTPEIASTIRPGDVVYLPENRRHYVVGQVRARGIAAPLFRLEQIGAEKPHLNAAPIPLAPDADPGWASYQLCEVPHDGQPATAPYRGGYRYSVRTLREQGQPVHPIPGDESRPDDRTRTLGERVRQLRERRALTQRELAQAVGVDERHVSSWEHGHSRPYPQNRRRLAEALGVTPDELMP